MTERGDLLMGRGTCDMKGFIAAAVAMAERLRRHKSAPPGAFCFTHDEEVGCLGAQSLVPLLKDREALPAIAIIGEPTEMRIIEGHKGCCEYTARFHGLEGHGSNPDRGVNAVAYAVRYVTRLMELAEELKCAPRGNRASTRRGRRSTSARLAGGVAHNVIPGKAEVEWEMRPVQYGDAEFVKEQLRQLYRDRASARHARRHALGRHHRSRPSARSSGSSRWTTTWPARWSPS